MPDIDMRFALITNKGEAWFPYQKEQRSTGRYGFALTKPGESDRHGGGTYTQDIEKVIHWVVHEQGSVRAVPADGSQPGNSVGLGKQKFFDYWVAPEFRHLVEHAPSKPLDRLPNQKNPEDTDPLEKALKQAEQSGNQEDELALRTIRTRRGQPKFRKDLLKSYNGRCCVTGCDVEAVLEAAHIVGHAQESNYSVSNGMLLRADIHTLFDLGLLTVDLDYQVRVASSLAQSEYGALEGKLISLPADKSEWPHADSPATSAI